MTHKTKNYFIKSFFFCNVTVFFLCCRQSGELVLGLPLIDVDKSVDGKMAAVDLSINLGVDDPNLLHLDALAARETLLSPKEGVELPHPRPACSRKRKRSRKKAQSAEGVCLPSLCADKSVESSKANSPVPASPSESFSSSVVPKVPRRKRKKDGAEKERVRNRRKKRIRPILRTADASASSTTFIRGESTYLKVLLPRKKAQLHFLRHLYSEEQCNVLAQLLLDDAVSSFWKLKKDSRRSAEESVAFRRYFVAGKWCAVGHSRPGVDTDFWAKPVGDISCFDSPKLMENLQYFAEKASSSLFRYRPDIFSIVQGKYPPIFGPFNIFFAMRGTVRMHRDPNDVVSFIFPLQVEANSKGGLEIGGTSLCFSSGPGDAILLDSALLLHGIPIYEGNPQDRLVGVFAIQKDFLRLHGITLPEVGLN